MAQEFASIDQDFLFLMFLDLCKAYNKLDHGLLLKTLERYGAGPNMQGLLAELWENREVVTRQNGFYVPHFRATCGTTQGGVALTKLFNVAVNIVDRHWLSLAPED